MKAWNPEDWARLVRYAGVALAGVIAATASGTREPSLAETGPPVLRDWVQPEYPRALRNEEAEGVVKVEFVVEVDGSVSRAQIKESAHPGFNEPALAAVAQWKFKPAVEKEGPVACGMGVTIPFHPAQLRQKRKPVLPASQLFMPFALRATEPVPTRGFNPAYPEELEARLLPGEIHVEVEIDAEGRARRTKILWASHPAFAETTLRTVARTEFEPARQGPLAIPSRMQWAGGFESSGARNSEILAANGLELLEPAPVRILPKPRQMMEPVYPRARLLTGQSGRAVIEFTIDEDGRTKDLTTPVAEPAEFGGSLRATVESWIFHPAQNETGPVAARMRCTWLFDPDKRPTERRLARRLQPGAAGFEGARGLDRPLEPVWRGVPVYPQGQQEPKPAGEALVECIVDRLGRVRLPHVVRATNEAFGSAAMTAVSQWVFEAPTKGGEPAEVMVRVPVGFKATAH